MAQTASVKNADASENSCRSKTQVRRGAVFKLCPRDDAVVEHSAASLELSTQRCPSGGTTAPQPLQFRSVQGQGRPCQRLTALFLEILQRFVQRTAPPLLDSSVHRSATAKPPLQCNPLLLS